MFVKFKANHGVEEVCAKDLGFYNFYGKNMGLTCCDILIFYCTIEAFSFF